MDGVPVQRGGSCPFLQTSSRFLAPRWALWKSLLMEGAWPFEKSFPSLALRWVMDAEATSYRAEGSPVFPASAQLLADNCAISQAHT